MVQPYACFDFKLKKTGVLPPYSNTGGQTSEFTLRPDYLTLSIPEFCAPEDVHKNVMDLLLAFCVSYPSGTAFEKRAGRNGFLHSKRMETHDGIELASIHWGGQRGRVFVELKGGVCKLLDGRQWEQIYFLARRYRARINRFDLAGDDWAGQYFDQQKILAAWKKNHYVINPSSVKPNYFLPPGIHDTPEGYTLEFGTKTSTHFHCIYQKFRESEGTALALKNPRWMRWEVRFYRQSKVELDLGMLHPDAWASAYLGSCSWLESCFKRSGGRFAHRVSSNKATALDAFLRAYMAFSRQWGGFIAECERLGLEVPKKAYKGHSPYAALTPYDKAEILDCLARGGLTSACAVGAAAYDDLEGVF